MKSNGLSNKNMVNLHQNSESVKTTHLAEISKQDAISTFREKKKMNKKVANSFASYDSQKASYLRNCSSNPVFAQIDGKPKLIMNFFCRQRLCPMCSWQRSKKTFANIFQIISEPEFQNQEFLFITLTVKNCKGEDLKETLDMMYQGWRNLTYKKETVFRKTFSGMFRALEITYNKKSKTYHPHFHVLASVENSYFKKENENYISLDRLIKIWRTACNLDYDPSVDIKKVKGEKYKSVAEVAKYTVKASEINSVEVLKTFDKVLHGRRLIAYHDLFKTVKARLKLEDDFSDKSEDYESIMANPNIVKEVYRWNIGTQTYDLVDVIGFEQKKL